MRRITPAIVFSCLGMVLVAAPPAARGDDATEGPTTLAGTWSATPLRETWSTQSWGDACGPKPGGQGAPGGTVQVAQQGSELTFSGAGRPFSTAQCWDPTPGLVRTSHSAGSRGWSTRCSSPKGDSRVSVVTTSITATDDTIVLVEQGQYQFVIQDTTCKASASRSRSFRLIQRAGEAPPPAPTPAPSASSPPAVPAPTASPAAPPEPPPPRPGCTPGAPARLEVAPGHKLVRPGDSFELTWKATDAAACPVAVRPRFLVEADDATLGKSIAASASGRITIAADAVEGSAAVVVEVVVEEVVELEGAEAQTLAARVVLEVATPERFDALLAERGFGLAGEGEAAIVAVDAAVGGTAGKALDGAGDRRSAFIAIVLGAGAALALAALVLLRKNRRVRLERSTEPPPAPLVALYDRPADDDPMRCPSCREVFPAQSVFCPKDGAPLVPAPRAKRPAGRPAPSTVPAAVAPVAAAARAVGAGKVCPTCGGRFDEAAAFCGRDGTQLVVVN